MEPAGILLPIMYYVVPFLVLIVIEHAKPKPSKRLGLKGLRMFLHVLDGEAAARSPPFLRTGGDLRTLGSLRQAISSFEWTAIVLSSNSAQANFVSRSEDVQIPLRNQTNWLAVLICASATSSLTGHMKHRVSR